MGFFSWKTSDTDESIANAHSNRQCRPVYMLQPNGKKTIEEPEYEGYGVFSGVDVHDWLARTNAHAFGFDPNAMSMEQVRFIGIKMEVGNVCQDTETGEYWHIFGDGRILVPGNFFSGRWNEVIPELGASGNELVESGRLAKRDISEVVTIPYPLKFSFDPDAKYEDLPAAKNCPDQGFFYEEAEEEDDD